MRAICPNPIITIPPAIAPLALADAKRFLRLEHTSDEDADVEEIIKAAAEYIRSRTETTLTTTTYLSTWGAFPACEEFDLPYGPVQAVTIEYYDGTNELVTLDRANYTLVAAGRMWSRVALAATASWPATYWREDAVRIIYTAGYGDTAADVPALVRHAMRLLVRQWYDERRAATPAGNKALMFSLDSLLASLSSGRVY